MKNPRKAASQKGGEPAVGNLDAALLATLRTGKAALAEALNDNRWRSRPNTASGSPDIVLTSTEAQNAFGRILDMVARDATVFIKKYDVTQAVLISVHRYEALSGRNAPLLDDLTAEFDDLLARMQAPEARAGLRDAFSASTEDLGRAAVEAAGRRAG